MPDNGNNGSRRFPQPPSLSSLANTIILLSTLVGGGWAASEYLGAMRMEIVVLRNDVQRINDRLDWLTRYVAGMDDRWTKSPKH